MIQFNELRITSDNKCLIIDTQVEDLSYFVNVTIDSIFIDTQDSWILNGPSDSAIRVYSKNNGKQLDIIKDDTGRHVRLEITDPLIDSSKNNMYFVYVIADISNAPESTEAPCECSKDRILGTVVNLYSMYQNLMGEIRELSNTCEVPASLINSFLQQEILDARALYPNSSLADLYDELIMPKELRKAHQANDVAVMEAYGFNWKTMTESECVAELMKMYKNIIGE